MAKFSQLVVIRDSSISSFILISFSFLFLAERLFHLKVAIGCLAALSFILLIIIAVLVWLLVKARKSAASKSKDEEPEEDPLPTLSGPRPSDSDFKVPEVRSSGSPATIPAGSKSPYMPLSTVDAPNGGASITFEATSF